MAVLKNLYVVIGRSGCGKTTIAEAFKEYDGCTQAESYTDRPKRYEDEVGHRFVTKEEFDKLEGKLLATHFSDHNYTMTQAIIDDADFIVLDPSGVKELKETYTKRNIIVIGLYCDREILRKRMYARGDDAYAIEKRLNHDDKVFEGMESICDVMLNNAIPIEKTYILAKGIIAGFEQD